MGAGASASTTSVWTAFAIEAVRAARAGFPPEEIARVKAIACELPREHSLPRILWRMLNRVKAAQVRCSRETTEPRVARFSA